MLGLQLVFFFGNLCFGIAATVLAPMILLRTGNDSVSLGLVQSGGRDWRRRWRRAHERMGRLQAQGSWRPGGLDHIKLFLRTHGFGHLDSVVIAMNVISSLFGPLINGSNQAIWQSKVAPDVQGRVFSARRLIAWMTNPISPLIAGTLADYVLEPAMRAPVVFPPHLDGLFLRDLGPGWDF